MMSFVKRGEGGLSICLLEPMGFFCSWLGFCGVLIFAFTFERGENEKMVEIQSFLGEVG